MIVGIGQWLRRADDWTVRRFEGHRDAAMRAGVTRNEQRVMGATGVNEQEQLLKQLSHEWNRRWGQGMSTSAEQRLSQALQSEVGRRNLVQNTGLAQNMYRGPGGMTQRGLGEAAADLVATNAFVRRGVLPGAIGVGGIAGGIAMTEGAQQLMALMGFMREAQAQGERVEQSPLA